MKPFEPTYIELANVVIQVLILVGVGATAAIYYKQLKAMQCELQAARGQVCLSTIHNASTKRN